MTTDESVSQPFKAACPVCATPTPEPTFALRDVPVFCNVLHDSRKEALAAASGDIQLSACPSCGLIYNRRFDPTKVEYAPSYENALHFSGRFRAFAEAMADHLVDAHDLRGKTVAEIGCGDAYMLRLLVDRGVGRAIGYDPSVSEEMAARIESPSIEVHRDLFASDALPDRVDALLCRHVLEHITDPVAFLLGIRRALGERDTLVYVEVPNAQWMLDACSPWDVIYEHCTYWTAPTLEAVFRRCGFTPLRVQTGYGDQFLMIEARAGAPIADELQSSRTGPDVAESLTRFDHECAVKFDRWAKQLEAIADSGRHAVAWGGGSKGVTFVNAVHGAREAITSVVDVNPRKHGRYVARCGLPILAPDELPNADVAAVFVMNPLYTDEIRASLAELRLTPEMIPV